MQKLTPDTKLTPENFVGTYWVSTGDDLPKHIIMMVSIKDSYTDKRTVGPIVLASHKVATVGHGYGGSFPQMKAEKTAYFAQYRQLSQTEYLKLMKTEFAL